MKKTEPIDKSTWGDGPWQSEPDRVECEHAGLPCLALRNMSGNWCGYAAVSPGHPLHGVPYGEPSTALCAALDALKSRPLGVKSDWTFARGLALLTGHADASPEIVLRVHGGLTYSDSCSGSICHVPKAGEPDNVWWFGFDCHHHEDFAPGSYARTKGYGYPFDSADYDHAVAVVTDGADVYRTLDYVQAQTNGLAEQLAALVTQSAEGVTCSQ